MAFAHPSGPVLHSLRFRLPLFLTLYSAVVGLVLFTVTNDLDAAFPQLFGAVTMFSVSAGLVLLAFSKPLRGWIGDAR